MSLLRSVATIAVLTLSLGTGALVTAAPSRALTAPHVTRTEAAWAAAVLALINAERQAHFLRPLEKRHRLVESAMYHNGRMAAANTLSHQLPHELAFSDRELAFGYHWSTAGENCGVNADVSLPGVLQLEQMMYHERPPGETGHRRNILSRTYRDVGVAVLIDRKHDRVWLTEDFGAPA